MRYLVGFMCVLALGIVLLLGCSEPPCGGECPDDGNECTQEYCDHDVGACMSGPVLNGTECTFDGVAGVCVSGVCGANLCEGVVCEDDGNLCTDDTCDYVDGTCVHPRTVCEDDGNECTDPSCDPTTGCYFTEAEDGRECYYSPSGSAGMCEAGVCVDPCDPEYEQESQCPIKGREAYFCCPGSSHCRLQC
jgi:hypothetical protein